MKGIQLQLWATQMIIHSGQRSTSTSVENISVCSEEWAITPLAMGIEPGPSRVCKFPGCRVWITNPGFHLHSAGFLEMTHVLYFATLIIFMAPCTNCLRRCQTPVGLHLVKCRCLDVYYFVHREILFRMFQNPIQFVFPQI